MIFSMKKSTISIDSSRDIDDQRILQSEWLRTFWAITEDTFFFQICSFCRIKKNVVIHQWWCLESAPSLMHWKFCEKFGCVSF